MVYCPKDLKPCIDDLCYGGSCLLLPGECPLTKCDGCNQLIAIDGSFSDWCECEDEWDGWCEDEWEDDD